MTSVGSGSVHELVKGDGFGARRGGPEASGCFITQFLGRDSDMVEAREAFIFGRGQHDDAGGAVALDPDGVRHGFVVIEAEALRNLTGSDLFDWQFHDSLIIFIVMLANRSEEDTSELQSLMRISYAVFCLKKKKTQ